MTQKGTAMKLNRIPPCVLFISLALLLPSIAAAQAVLVDIPNGPNAALPNDPLNEDAAVFNVSTFDDTPGRAFYFSAQNNRILVNFQRSNGSWVYPTSQVAVEIPEGPPPVPSDDSTIALGAVLDNPAADYRNPWNGQSYRRVMYFIYQPTFNNNDSAGYPCLAFSNDGLDWSAPKVRVVLPGQPLMLCDDPNLNTLKLEAISGVRSQGTLYLAGLEGDLTTLAQFGTSNRTLTYFFETFPTSPHVLTNLGELPTSGLFLPNVPGGTPDRYMRNLDFTYDPTSDKALLIRATPFPYLLSGGIPCSGVCPGGLGTFPMRGQIYSQRINSNPLGVLSGTWQLEVDVGGPTGWTEDLSTGVCSRYPANHPLQEDVGVDLDSLNVHRDGNGFVAREADETATLYMGSFPDRQLSCDTASSPQHTFLDGELRTLSFATEAIVGEVGQVTNLTHTPQTVVLSRPYVDPVVFARPSSYNGTNTALVRVTSVLPDRFTFFVHEAPDHDGAHTNETVSYLVLEAGRWQLENGALLEVGKVTTASEVGPGIPNTFSRVTFQSGFSSTPAVLTQVQTNDNPHWVMTRQRSASATGVDVALQEDDASTGHGSETVGWLAVEPTSGAWSGRQLRAGNSANAVTHNPYSLTWSAGGSPSHFLASIATFDGGDSAHLRYRNLTGTSVEVHVEEDTTADREINHTTEVVSYLVLLGSAGDLSAVPLP